MPHSLSPHLPPFGIHDLTREPTSLIRITKKEYDNTIKSQPDTQLLYIDEDDGEVVTVGSSHELAERLKESVAQTEVKNPLTGEFVHVFDIKHTARTKAVWQDHEAYSSKYFLGQPSVIDSPSDSLFETSADEEALDSFDFESFLNAQPPTSSLEDALNRNDLRSVSSEGYPCESFREQLNASTATSNERWKLAQEKTQKQDQKHKLLHPTAVDGKNVTETEPKVNIDVAEARPGAAIDCAEEQTAPSVVPQSTAFRSMTLPHDGTINQSMLQTSQSCANSDPSPERHALRDYKFQCTLLDQDIKKKLAAAVQAQQQLNTPFEASTTVKSESEPRLNNLSASSSATEEIFEAQDHIGPTIRNLGAGVISGLHFHLIGLANVLDLASDGFRKAAEKARGTDTSIVEDVLKGVQDIFLEISSLAGSTFAEGSKKIDGDKIIAASQNVSTYQPPSVADEEIQEVSKSSFEAEVKQNVVEVTKSPSPSIIFSAPNLSKSESPASDELLVLDKTFPGTFPKVRFQQNRSQLSRPSSDHDLTTKIKAKGKEVECEESRKTFEDKKQRHEFREYPSDSFTNKKASILDSDHEDSDFTARYPPLKLVQRSNNTGGVPERLRILSRPSVKFGDLEAQINPSYNVDDGITIKREVDEHTPKPLPGSWPEPKSDDVRPKESSGAFFNRMTGRSGNGWSGLRLITTHPNLLRSNTTASSNPASRLNGPFDPGFLAHSSSKIEAKSDAPNPYPVRDASLNFVDLEAQKLPEADRERISKSTRFQSNLRPFDRLDRDKSREHRRGERQCRREERWNERDEKRDIQKERRLRPAVSVADLAPSSSERKLRNRYSVPAFSGTAGQTTFSHVRPAPPPPPPARKTPCRTNQSITEEPRSHSLSTLPMFFDLRPAFNSMLNFPAQSPSTRFPPPGPINSSGFSSAPYPRTAHNRAESASNARASVDAFSTDAHACSPSTSTRIAEPLTHLAARSANPLKDSAGDILFEACHDSNGTRIPRDTARANPSQADERYKMRRAVKSLQEFGYGGRDSDLDQHRLEMYAEASNFDISAAVDLIEEDKKATSQFKRNTRKAIVTERAPRSRHGSHDRDAVW